MTARQWTGDGWQRRDRTEGEEGRALVVINPNSTRAVTDGIAEALAPFAGWGPPIRCETLAAGPPGIEDDAQVAEVVPPLLARAAELEPEAAGFVIACFSDPGLHALRARTALPVLGIGEAACLAACALGDRFGIVSVAAASLPRHARALRACGLAGRCAGDRACGLGVAGLAAPGATDRLVATAHALAREDGAEVLVLGCAGMAHARATLEEATGLPVIEPCQAAVAQALARIAIGRAAAGPPSTESAHAR